MGFNNFVFLRICYGTWTCDGLMSHLVSSGDTGCGTWTCEGILQIVTDRKIAVFVSTCVKFQLDCVLVKRFQGMCCNCSLECL